MSNYKNIASVSVAHNYFVDGKCRALAFAPTPLTFKIMQQHQLLLRTDDGGFVVAADEHSNISLTEALMLRFEVFTRDVHFFSYTEIADGQWVPLYFTTSVADENNILVAQNYSDANLPAELEPVNKMFQRNNIFIIDVEVFPSDLRSLKDDASIAQPRDYSVKLAARELHWKYYFFGDLAEFDLTIDDLDNHHKIDFDECNEPVANNGKALISRTPIAMNSAPQQRFQLKDKSSFGKVLIKRLPNAGVQLIGKGRNSSGQSVLVAEIYINH